MYEKVELSLSDNQINKIRRAKKNGEEVTITISKNQYGGAHDLYLTHRQIEKLKKSSGGIRIKLSKSQIKAQKGGWIGAVLKAALPILGSLGLSAASGAISGATSRAVQGSGLYRTGDGLFRVGDGLPLYFNKDQLRNILEIIKSLESDNIIKKGSCTACMNEIKSQSGGFIGTLLATLASTVLPMLFSKN